MLNLAAIPTYPGAEALSAKGVASTLAPANRARVAAQFEAPTGPKSDLLVDPQTAGGLLAALAPDRVRKAVADCAEAGLTAHVIGHITDGPTKIVVA